MTLRWDEDGGCYIADDVADLKGWTILSSWRHKENVAAMEITRTCGDGAELRRAYVRCGDPKPWLVCHTDGMTRDVRGYVMARTKEEAEEKAGTREDAGRWAGLFIKEVEEIK